MTSTASPAMQKADLDAVSPDVHGLISKQTAELDGVSVTRVCFDVGARWSNDLKDYAGTHSSELPHVALVLSGRLHIVMDDGSEDEFGPNQVMLLPPGHDAWTVGNEPCVFVEFSRGNDYRLLQLIKSRSLWSRPAAGEHDAGGAACRHEHARVHGWPTAGCKGTAE